LLAAACGIHCFKFKLGHKKLPMPGFAFLLYLRLHIILGWILTTLWIGAFTGLVKT